MFDELFEESWKPGDKTRDEMIESLKLKMARLEQDCPFEVGDLVHPVEGSNRRGRGRPSIVIETFPFRHASPLEQGGPFDTHDMIVATERQATVLRYTANSMDYEQFE